MLNDYKFKKKIDKMLDKAVSHSNNLEIKNVNLVKEIM